MTIYAAPASDIEYFANEIPGFLISGDGGVSLEFTLSHAGNEIYSQTYLYGGETVTIAYIAAMVMDSLVAGLVPYTFTWTLTTDGGAPLTGSFMAKRPGNIIVDSEPETGKLYFQKNIPDILLSKDGYNSVLFDLKKGETVILSEIYTYDIDGKIRIRNLYEVIEKYFSSDSVIDMPGTTNIADSLALEFSYTITQDVQTHDIAFTVLKCDAEITADASEWTAANFLTRCYLEKRTAKSRNEYLSFLMKNAYGEVTINYKAIYLLEGVRTEIIGTLGTIAQQTGDLNVATFNASIHRIMTVSGLVNFTEVLQYDIWLTGTGMITNIYSFLVDNTPYRNTKSFVFINCFGVLESWTSTGTGSNKKTAEYNLGNIDNHYRKITQDFYSEKTCNSGFLWETEMEWIDDLIKSFNVILYSQDITQNEEITLIGVDKNDTESNILQAFAFGYRRAKNLHTLFANAAKNISDFTFDQTFN